MAITRRSFLEGLGATALLPMSCHLPSASSGNVVVVLIDQLRKDAADRWLSRVNALARSGIRFEAMRSAAPWTYPSVISMFSGLHPQQHGADGQLKGQFLSTFDEAVPLLHRQLRHAGYETAAFIANPYLDSWNPFHIGFDAFYIDFIKRLGPVRGSRHQRFATDRMYGNQVNAAIFQHFDGRPHAAPEFTYIHYIDVHGPWVPGVPFKPDYQAAVKYIDARVVELYDFFLRRYAGDMLFFVTSDHGRAVDDDLQVGYGPAFRKNKLSVHDFNLRIPCAVLGSRLIERARVVEEPCSNIDIKPTLLEWLGLRLGHPLPSISLLPAIQGRSIPGHERALYARVSAFGGRSECIVWRGHKYVRFRNLETGMPLQERVFDIAADPRETDSLGNLPPEAERLLAQAGGPDGMTFEARFEPLDPETRGRLRALGYLTQN